MGVAMPNSAVNKNPNIKLARKWTQGVNDRTAYDYPGTHDRVMKIMRYILHQVESGEANVWGVLVSGLDSWLEICTNNMRIIDLGLAKDGIELADIRGAVRPCGATVRLGDSQHPVPPTHGSFP